MFGIDNMDVVNGVFVPVNIRTRILHFTITTVAGREIVIDNVVAYKITKQQMLLQPRGKRPIVINMHNIMTYQVESEEC